MGYTQCYHIRTKVQIGNHFVLASEFFEGTDIEKEPIPDLGIYLAFSWEKLFTPPTILGVPEGFSTKAELPYPVILVPWEDQGGISLHTLDWLMKGILANMYKGKLIEIGCFGGHGRTGTVLACILGFLEKVPAHEAIDKLRARYCTKAVESIPQANLIASYLGSPPELARAKVRTLISNVWHWKDGQFQQSGYQLGDY